VSAAERAVQTQLQSESEVRAPAVSSANGTPDAVDLPSDSGGGFVDDKPDVASAAVHMLRTVCAASAELRTAVVQWQLGPSSSHRPARLDDATRATLAEPCARLASLHEAVVGCLNEQPVSTEGGDGERVIAWAAVARDTGRGAAQSF
jgi:hypothetical protein